MGLVQRRKIDSVVEFLNGLSWSLYQDNCEDNQCFVRHTSRMQHQVKCELKYCIGYLK